MWNNFLGKWIHTNELQRVLCNLLSFCLSCFTIQLHCSYSLRGPFGKDLLFHTTNNFYHLTFIVARKLRWSLYSSGFQNTISVCLYSLCLWACLYTLYIYPYGEHHVLMEWLWKIMEGMNYIIVKFNILESSNRHQKYTDFEL